MNYFFNSVKHTLATMNRVLENEPHVHSFCAFILLGTKPSWLFDFEKQLFTYKNNKIKTERMIIYQISGFDFIFPIVDLNETNDVYKMTCVVKEFIKKQKYLESHIIFFMSYMSPKIRQILVYIYNINIDINIVSYPPKEFTSDLYFQVCLQMNIKSEFIRCNSPNIPFIHIIKKMVKDTCLCELFGEYF